LDEHCTRSWHGGFNLRLALTVRTCSAYFFPLRTGKHLKQTFVWGLASSVFGAGGFGSSLTQVEPAALDSTRRERMIWVCDKHILILQTLLIKMQSQFAQSARSSTCNVLSSSCSNSHGAVSHVWYIRPNSTKPGQRTGYPGCYNSVCYSLLCYKSTVRRERGLPLFGLDVVPHRNCTCSCCMLLHPLLVYFGPLKTLSGWRWIIWSCSVPSIATEWRSSSARRTRFTLSHWPEGRWSSGI